MNLSQLVKDKRAKILRIAANYGAQSVRVFGSVARGETRDNSDLDLLAQLAPDRSLLDLIAIKQDLEDLLGCSDFLIDLRAGSCWIAKSGSPTADLAIRREQTNRKSMWNLL